MTEIFHRVQIKAPQPTIIRALTEQKGLARWWTTDTRARPEVGSLAEFRFADGAHGMGMRVEAITAAEVRWKVESGPDDWLGTEIVFSLEPKDGPDVTVLRFRHRGWKEGVDFMGHCSAKWAYFLFSLKAYLEVGAGTPHPHDMLI